MQEDLYNILKVSKGASQDEIKKSYKKLAIELHPDKNQGDAGKEEQFKKVNDAYSVLGDPKKREMYDKFGIVDGGAPGGPGGPGGMPDIFQHMFAGGGPGGFSFVFGGPPPPSADFDPFGGGNPFDDILGQMFGGGGNMQRNSENIDVPITLSDVYHGTNKKIEFELLDMCHKCQGSGAQDPSYVIRCLTCKGEGRIATQINPFMVSSSLCESCAGTGSTVKNNKFCQHCKGKKTQYTKKAFELAIPKGIPNGHQVSMNGKGSWNEKSKQYGNICFRLVYDVKEPFSVQGHDVHYKVDLTIEELLCGFEKNIDLYGEKIKIASAAYFNPNNPKVCQGKGLPSSKKTHGNLVINFNIKFDNNHRLSKYADVLQKIFKRKPIEITEGDNVIVV